MTVCLPHRPLSVVKTNKFLMRRKLPLMRERSTKRIRPSILGSLSKKDAQQLQPGVHTTLLPNAKRRYVEITGSDDDEPSTTKLVQFSHLCETIEIPHRNDYTEAQKSLMYTCRKIIKRNAKINTAEYRYDGWSLEDAAEEDDFVLVQGVRLHPSHAAKE